MSLVTLIDTLREELASRRPARPAPPLPPLRLGGRFYHPAIDDSDQHQAEIAARNAARSRTPDLEMSSFWGPQHAPARLEVTLPFWVGSVPAGYLSKPAGGPGSPGAITLSTPAISYADFELVGVDFQAVITMEDPADVPPVVTVVSWGISGGFNQVYAEQPISHAGGQVAATAAGQVGASSGLLNYSKTLPALRQDKLELGRTNTAQLVANFYQMRANSGVIDVVITASLKLRVANDDNVDGGRR